MFDFTGRNGIVTGAGSGIGKATTLELARAGGTVLAVGRRREALDEVVAEAAAFDGRVVPHVADVTVEADVRGYVERAESELGPVTFFFNNAGVGGAHKSVIDTTMDELDHCMAVNFRACFMGMKYVLPAMKRAGGGQVVNNGSLLSFKGAVNRSDYTASKHAILGVTKCAASECARDNIQVNIVCAGPIDTPLQKLSEQLVNPADPEYERRRYDEAIPMGRYGTPKEIADTVLFLLSGMVPYLTGTEVTVDGGFFSG
ncbi:MAG: SDR family oxidoreductase [Bauldia sp.]|nr:SDR family oxidoreductase [Bauldia sp.]